MSSSSEFRILVIGRKSIILLRARQWCRIPIELKRKLLFLKKYNGFSGRGAPYHAPTGSNPISTPQGLTSLPVMPVGVVAGDSGFRVNAPSLITLSSCHLPCTSLNVSNNKQGSLPYFSRQGSGSMSVVILGLAVLGGSMSVVILRLAIL